MATPSSHGVPLRVLLLALPLLSILIVFQLLHRPTPLPPPLLRTHADAASSSHRAEEEPSSPPLTSNVPPPPAPKPEDSSSEPTSLRHVVFGIASSKRTLPLRLPLLRLWLRAPARAFLFLDAPAPDADARDLPPGLALRVSADASHFPYTHPRGLPSAVRVARIAGELVSALKQQQLQEEEVRWLVLADDDTAFVLPNLLHTLRRYDHREPWYLGARSESAAQNAWHGFAMAYGGGGIAVSWPLARRLARVVDSCVLRYPHLYGSDARIYACLAELGVELTHEPGFHQIDLHGDISGLLRAHPLSPFVSLHHLDHVYPLYPGMDRTRAMQHFFRAASADPARILQQTMCICLTPNITPEMSAKRGGLFFLKSITSGEGKTETTYNRQPPRKCSPDLIPLKNLRLIKVTSERLQLAPGKALRRHCCDIAPSSSDTNIGLNIRKCEDDELIAMHS
ncbi:unnamed protein product [Miscanthus lutarioriparius]|uniref:Uncharacterized protein n=1 Tax=Miscanthus lutarioriparius TaxID=422564 RepID=A0A811SPL6_9POAL|nr:unnamed protein product [Miscanthus lutarioriparius]